MNIIYYPDKQSVETACGQDEPLLVLISFDGQTLIVSQIDEAVEHHILLQKAGFPDRDIDKYFRLVVDKSGADWTFAARSKSFRGKKQENFSPEEFYNEGMKIIPEALAAIGYDVPIEIPKRYRRHFDIMNSEN